MRNGERRNESAGRVEGRERFSFRCARFLDEREHSLGEDQGGLFAGTVHVC